jgi:hypothetical protein
MRGSKSDGFEKSRVGRFVTSKVIDAGGKVLRHEMVAFEESVEVIANEPEVLELPEPVELDCSKREVSIIVRSPPSRKPRYTRRLEVV